MSEGSRAERQETAVYPAHPILRGALKAREHIRELDAQVRAVFPSERDVPPDGEALEKIFEAFAKHSDTWERMRGEETVPSEVREENIRSVNKTQEEFLRKRKLFPEDEQFSGAEAKTHRYFDIYARIDPEHHKLGDMDQFQLAVIARTVRWYIENGHNLLFDRIRIVPDKRIQDLDGPLAAQLMPRSAFIAAPDAEPLVVRDKSAFMDSMTFANRFFLTHAKAREATERGTIPLITWSVFWNPFKRWRIRDVASLRARPDNAVVFRALFNADDRGTRIIRRPAIHPKLLKLGTVIRTRGEVPYHKADVAGNITGLIDETLRCLRELEEREIQRAV